MDLNGDCRDPVGMQFVSSWPNFFSEEKDVVVAIFFASRAFRSKMRLFVCMFVDVTGYIVSRNGCYESYT